MILARRRRDDRFADAVKGDTLCAAKGGTPTPTGGATLTRKKEHTTMPQTEPLGTP
jgi:hypothetical protein